MSAKESTPHLRNADSECSRQIFGLYIPEHVPVKTLRARQRGTRDLRCSNPRDNAHKRHFGERDAPSLDGCPGTGTVTERVLKTISNASKSYASTLDILNLSIGKLIHVPDGGGGQCSEGTTT